MPSLTLVIGANGAGKSTWCRAHREELPANFYDADSIAQGLGSYDDPEKQREARALVDGHIETHLEHRETFGFESTYSGASRPNIVRHAHSLGYEVNAVFVGTNHADINIMRVARRVRLYKFKNLWHSDAGGVPCKSSTSATASGASIGKLGRVARK